MENKLFATLDPTTRRLWLPAGLEVLVTDTVGFIQKLPHAVVAAFRATLEELEGAVGKALARELAEKSLAIYRFAHDYAETRGVIIADTKMEFGFIEGEVCLIDELLTPDSSRFWDRASYQVGRSQASFDKQPVRDWLVSSRWNKEPPAPNLPPEVIASTTQRYREAYRRLTGRTV